MRRLTTLFTLMLLLTFVVSAAHAQDDPETPPIELTPNLCDDPSNVAAVMGSMGDSGDGPSYGEVNTEQIMRMMQAPTEGPFYMVNLIDYREQAEYPDGRETELTGREANNLYSPLEFIQAIGAQPVFTGEVTSNLLGEDSIWDDVAIVEYPCPLAVFAMGAHPEFQATSIHKDAGLEASTIMVTHVRPFDAFDLPEVAADDTAFELVQVVRYNEEAQYADGSDEPFRTGQEAMDVYAASILEAGLLYGVYPKARFEVEGVYIGDGQDWDEVWVYYAPSQEAFDAFMADPVVVAAQYHRDAAVDNAYELVTDPTVSMIPTSSGNETSDQSTSDETAEALVAYEIQQIVSPNEIVVWRNLEMSQAEFDAIELPNGWIKNQAREIVTDGGEIFKSPDAESDGEFVEEDLFGHTWEHVTTVIETNVELDEQGLLSGAVVYKHHEMIFDAGRTVSVLISPEGDHYIRNTRDFGRTSDDFAVPDGWQLVHFDLSEQLIIQLPTETLVIRTQNQDSFQGPITELQDQLNTESDVRLGFEIIQVISPDERLAWRVLSDMTLEEFEVLEVPTGWIKNQPRELDFNTGTFTQSPGMSTGEYTDAEYFGYEWRHVATVSGTIVQLDAEGILTASPTTKSHQLTWDQGRTIYLLVSPEGERYIRVNRDLNRSSDTFTLPAGWQLVDATIPQDLTFQLPNPTLVIRTDNGDSFQGPFNPTGNPGQPPAQAAPQGAALTDDTIPTVEQTQFLPPPDDFLGFRFCEVLSTVEDDTSITVSVYNTMGHSDCPPEQWNQLDADAIAEQYGVTSIELYGPRYWLLNGIIEEGAVGGGQVADFGGMELRLSGQLTFDTSEIVSEPTDPYIPNDIRRNTIFVYLAGNTVYELTSPDGEIYRMHETGEAVLDDLQTLGERLDLPNGWTYAVRTLERDEPVVAVDGVAHILQDSLGNVYQQIESVETSAQEQSIGLIDDAIPAVQQTQFMRPPTDLRGFPYCEVLAMVQDGSTVTVTVYNTMGHSDCPADQWANLDADAIAEEYGLMQAQLNGPRYWLMNSISSDGVSSGGQVSVFGGMEMRLSGVVTLELSDLMAASTPPYTESQIARDTTYIYRAGNEVYELVSPDGAVYRMQSYLLEGGDVSFDDLNTLGNRLTLPDGWSFQTRVLTEDENVVAVGGMATILRDDLENTYQLLEGISASAQDSGNAVVGITPITIEVGEFTFNGLTAGPEDGELVLLLHGFPQSSIEWRAQLSALGEAGYRAVAPDQRGYSPDARPEAVEDYAFDLLVGDVLAMADVLGADTFHLVGHDWGGSVAWGVAAAAPERVITLSVFSVPHPLAFDNQLADMTSCQYAASAYFDFLTSPVAESSILAGDAAILRSFYDGVSADAVDEYVELLASEPALRAAINWYRANLDGRRMVGRADEFVTVPTLYVWSDGDAAICQESAEATVDFVTGPYRFEVLEGVGHFIPEEAADVATQLILEHLSQ